MIEKKIIEKDIAHYIINPELTDGKIVNIYATEPIIRELSDKTIEQAINTARISKVEQINLNADAHEGYGCPIGSTVVTKDIIMPGPVGYDISCSVSYIQTDLDIEKLEDKREKRKFINKLLEYVPHGTGKERAKKQIKITEAEYLRILNFGASDNELMEQFNIPNEWIEHLERKSLPADVKVLSQKTLSRGFDQSGSLGSGNHFLEAQKVKIIDENLCAKWGIIEKLGFLTHCGSRGLGHQIATEIFSYLRDYFNAKNIYLPDKELVYADLNTEAGKNYVLAMGCAANFAIVNHLLLNNAIKQALEELYPSNSADLVYFISHNLAQVEIVDDISYMVHRKGATRCFPKYHSALKGTKYYETGHPVIIPGSSMSGSMIMVGKEKSKENYYTVPHGAGRTMGRNEARKKLSQEYVNKKMDEAGVLFNKRNYPVDEFSEAYKNYNEVVNSIELNGFATSVAKLKPLFVIKGD